MKIGFIGAGKVGFSIGKMLADHGKDVIGYYSRNPISAEKAAEFTKTMQYLELEKLVKDSDILFLTVPDDAIETVWQQIKQYPLANKMICHCSGSLSSTIFSDIEKTKAYGYSIHPLLAVSDRYKSYQEIPKALFTIEGSKEKIQEVKKLFKDCGIKVEIIDQKVKTRYHAAAVMSSNLIVGLIDAAQEELKKCGFSDEGAKMALAPLIKGNVENVLKKGTKESLTGPIERNDVGTIKKHLETLDGINKIVYEILSSRTLELAEVKNQNCNYSQMEKILNLCN